MNRTITDIIPPSRRQRMAEEDHHGDLPPAPTPPPPPRPLSDEPYELNDRKRFPYGIAGIVVLIVLASVAAMYWFSGAEVRVTPTSNSAFVSGNFTATAGGGDLSFEVITVEKTAGLPVPAESTETVNEPAQGTIIVMNKQPEAQPLIKNTRFETPNGLIYRIPDSITVPAGSASDPGELEVTVYADAAGDSYNQGPTTFTVPGLAGSTAFDLVTARSEGPMTGGFSGERAGVSQATRDSQDTQNRATLETALIEAAREALPEGYTLVPGGTFVSYAAAPDVVEGDTVAVTTRGTMQAVIFPQHDLAKAVAYQVVGSYAGQPISIPNTEGLTLDPTEEGAPIATDTFSFKLSGNTTLIWDVDPMHVAGAVAGKSRGAAETVLQSFPDVDSAMLILRPFWSSSFPDDPTDIEVSVAKPNK